jgi:uncharacterized RDD family membrane protein YckC
LAGAGAAVVARAATVPALPGRPPTIPRANPYAAPATTAGGIASAFSEAGAAPLASRGSRLAAALLDGLAAMVSFLPGFAVLIWAGVMGSLTGAETTPASAALPVGVLLGLLGLGAFVVYQIRLLLREGQTLGKKMMKIRIVRYDDGTLPGAGRIIGLRAIVNGLLGNIPLFGAFYALADVLFIFGAERRCIHDYLAGTKVVEAG